MFFVILLALGAAWGAALGGFVWKLHDAKTTIQAIEEFRPKVGSKVYSSDAELLGEYSKQQRQLVNLNQIPLNLQKAFVATEDNRFYQHKGVRPESIVRAGLDYLQKGGRIRGASTITQELVRDPDVLGIGDARKIERKIHEAIVALQVERDFTKDEILELYLNQIFLGVSAYGVEAAARQYFGKSCSELTLAQCALLAGLARTPNENQPFKHIDNAHQRRDIVLGQMLADGFISREEHDAAVNESVEDALMTDEKKKELAKNDGKIFSTNRFKAPYFVEEVRGQIGALHNKQDLFEDGLEIRTTLDMRLQRAAEEVLTKALDEFDANRLKDLKRQHKEGEFMPVSGALVCIDNRPGYRGFVRAMVGGRDYDKSEFNCATQAKRQPGSSIKPFVWAAAIDNGKTPSSIVVDEPLTIASPWGGVAWSPRNFTPDFAGPVTLRCALQKSINIVSVKLVRWLSLPVVRFYLQRAGITTPIDNSVGLTIALGSPEVHILDMCVAYSCFPNGGMRYDPVLIQEIKNRDGLTIIEGKSKAAPEPVMPAGVACVMTHLLEGVCQFGTGASTQDKWRKAHPDIPRGGKTGTTNDSRDAWFCGFTPHYTCVVWMGYPKTEISLGRGANYTGGHLANPIWTDFMIQAEDGLSPAKFEMAEGVIVHKIDRNSGEPGGDFEEYYLKNTEPGTKTTPRDRKPSLDDMADSLLESF